MKTEVYSWRVSSELKSELEREAHLRKVPVSKLLDTAVRNWLKTSRASNDEEEEQRRLHKAASECLGALSGRDSHRAENVRQAVRERLGRRHGR